MRDVLDIRRGGITTPRSPLNIPSARRSPFIETACCFAAVASLAASPLVGTVPAAIFLVSIAVLAFLRPAETVRDIALFLPLLALPLLAMVSTIWSDAPERTLRAAIQMMLTMMAAIMICRRISSGTLILMLFAAMAVACMFAVPAIPDALARRQPLIGPYGSKNAMAYAAHLLIALSLAVAFEPKRSAWWRLAACCAIPPALGLMYLAQSAGALMSLIISSIVFPSLVIFGRVGIRWRACIVAFVLVTLAIALVGLSDLQTAAADFRQDVLHKDATLTGRAFLWDFAYRLAHARPMLGYGYYSFWREGNIDAEGLWRHFGINTRTGFNFHNTFIEIRIDLGWTGLIVLVTTCAAIVGLALVRQFARPSVGLAFLLALTVSELVRSAGEVSLFVPFSYYTVLLMGTAIYALQPFDAAGEAAARASNTLGRRMIGEARKT